MGLRTKGVLFVASPVLGLWCRVSGAGSLCWAHSLRNFSAFFAHPGKFAERPRRRRYTPHPMDVTFPGPEGLLEGVLWHPEAEPRAAAVVCHPHPSHGGKMSSSVVFRAARGLQSAGLAVLRFNFRGVGGSQGSHHGEGGPGSEEDDLAAALDFLHERFPGLPLWGGGFSFGSRQVIGLAVREPQRMARVLLIALPVLRYECAPATELTVPGLALMAENDDFGTLAALRERFPNLADVLELDEIPDVDHFFTGATRDLQSRVQAWATRTLDSNR